MELVEFKPIDSLASGLSPKSQSPVLGLPRNMLIAHSVGIQALAERFPLPKRYVLHSHLVTSSSHYLPEIC